MKEDIMGPGLFSLQTAFTYLVKGGRCPGRSHLCWTTTHWSFLAHFTPCEMNLICFISRNVLEKKSVLT